MEATTAPREQWTFAQWALVIVISLQLLWALAGLIAEPSIDFGDDAVTEKVLGVDFNGVHALSGFLLFLPGYYFATRAEVGRLLLRSTSRSPSGRPASGRSSTTSPPTSSPSPTTTPTPTSTWRPAPSSP